ncbi:hypothetical protein [Caldimonas brevitalea]|nr:hypothetical protein [Caldimonas brevitalea]
MVFFLSVGSTWTGATCGRVNTPRGRYWGYRADDDIPADPQMNFDV